MVRTLAIADPYDDTTAYGRLRPIQREFVDMYVNGENPVAIVTRIFPNMSDEARMDRLKDYKRNPDIKRAIQDRGGEMVQQSVITKLATVREVKRIAFSNMKNYVKVAENGEPFIDLTDVTIDQWAAIKEITIEDYVEGRGENSRDVRKVKIKLYDKLAGLEKIIKLLQMYAPETINLNVNKVLDASPEVSRTMTPEEAAELYARSLEA